MRRENRCIDRLALGTFQCVGLESFEFCIVSLNINSFIWQCYKVVNNN